MQDQIPQEISINCPFCHQFLDTKTRKLVAEALSADFTISDLPEILSSLETENALPPFLPDLARLEIALYETASISAFPDRHSPDYQINPTLRLLEVTWQNLLALIRNDTNDTLKPSAGQEVLMVWRQPGTGELRHEKAFDEDLLVLKIIIENLTFEDVARSGNLPTGAIDHAMERAAEKGIIQAPDSLLKRTVVLSHNGSTADLERFSTARTFALQWHLTQACDLHCRHCYDRSSRKSLDYPHALKVLEDFRAFCRSRHVRGQVSFSGGNPLLYPHFYELYQAAVELGLGVAVMGNPSSRKNIEKIIAIKKPGFFQISMEGLPEHNDYIRGAGHFENAMVFLELLQELGVFSMVMLTLTRENMPQVLPLTELLRGKVDSFTFNRLALVGEGAGLDSVDPDDFPAFLGEYLSAAAKNPTIRLKENLINIIRHKKGKTLFPGCAGHGCGAAFNFITLLPDGEVHACRKFPSPIGNILKQNFGEIYDSSAAECYRQGSNPCRDCAIRAACRGCMAVAHGMGLDIFRERDPYCFIDG